MGRSAVLVTGASGFIGRHVVDRLLRNGAEVIAFDCRIDTRNRNDIEFIVGDIRDDVAVAEAIGQATSWIHLAGVLGTQETISNPRPAAEVNILGGLNVLQAASQHQAPGIYISVGNWFEDNPYSLTKYSVERFCSMYRKYHDVNVGVVRGFNAYGPGQSIPPPYGRAPVRKIVPSFVSRAIHGDDIEVYGSGLQVMDMIYVADLANIIVACSDYVAAGGDTGVIFEAGTGRRTTVAEIAAVVLEAVGTGQIKHLPIRKGETADSVVLAKPETLSSLGISANDLTTLEDGIRQTVEHYQNEFRNTSGSRSARS
jgi:UDP-glucose 4-epimerase